MSLTISLIARGRPQTLLQTLILTLPNIKRRDTRLLVSIDDDDTRMIETLAGTNLHDNEKVIISCRPREDSRGEKYDRALFEAPADVYMLAVDHAPILEPGFDEKVLKAASYWPDGIGCVYSPMANFSFPALQSVTAGLADKLGYLYPHDYPFWYIDHHIDDVVRMIDRISYADISLDCHSLRPAKTLECRDVLFWTTYFDAACIVRRKEARAIIDSPDFLTPDWQKEVLRRHFPLIEHRSRWINNHGRDIQVEKQRGGTPPDERYLRIRARAEVRLLELIGELEASALQRAA